MEYDIESDRVLWINMSYYIVYRYRTVSPQPGDKLHNHNVSSTPERHYSSGARNNYVITVPFVHWDTSYGNPYGIFVCLFADMEFCRPNLVSIKNVLITIDFTPIFLTVACCKCK